MSSLGVKGLHLLVMTAIVVTAGAACSGEVTPSLAPTTVPLSAGPIPTTLASLPDVDFTAGSFYDSFPDDTHGWLATGNKILVTVDGGSTWSEQSDNRVGPLDFVSASVGWAASGTALLTTGDGGRSWREVSRDIATR